MKLRLDQLAHHCRQGLAPLYLISGDVPLLVQEAADLLRSRAREAGCQERIVLHAESGFDWQALLQAAGGMSLFAQRRLIELRLPGGRPGDAGSKALQAYAGQHGEDDVLLLISGKLDKAASNSKWYKALDRIGVMVPVWPLERRQLPAWIERRMRERGLQPSRQAAMLLADRVEGNLLACAQEIDKLQLLHGTGKIDVQQVLDAVADSARFDVYTLVDSVLEGDAPRLVRILDGLRAEGVDPTLVIWAMAREIRTMAVMAGELASGAVIEQVLARRRVWERRRPLVSAALKRHKTRRWWGMLCHAARIDRIIKGVQPGKPWDELLQLCLLMATAKQLIRV